ncbi:ATP-binding SpoIIE family protein phosphatase [Actinomadura rupiterrae]|uniref:ATP-binding SpoIIE family protein phosphatase n=1 Tax=Actinomadura rupiterrae TaxID=559627 RepID=UPI0020A315CD|nr:ATP-binding SpoIIE family protein phosphatase [Actinomadura rupiterrae]MCP2340910.1 serine phosphatase RsbU (regulator of sigma subunit)/anti-sigma regulatory factor (Ser/Thr protein kinase) [Actinomadura rupiterrae]
MESSTRILLLGLDSAGSVIQSDRNAEALFAGRPGGLRGALLEDVVPGGAAPLAEALRSGRERTAMLPVGSPAEREAGVAREAVVTVHPMSPAAPGATACPAALAVIRMPTPLADRFVDPALTRRALLEDGLPRIGATLDLELLAHGLMDVLVPHFCNSGALLLLDSLVDAEEPPESGTPPLRRMAVCTDDGDSAWDAAFPTGEVLAYPAGTPHERCVLTGEPVLTLYSGEDATLLAEKWGRPPVADLLKGTSMLLLPVRLDEDAPGAAGFFVCTRNTAHRPFDAYDIEIGMEFAARAARFVDGARRYGRERATALTLQRSLLPTGLSAPSSVEVHHRYLPGSRLVEVGGDWYESIALPGGRVALVVGDVAGHGVRAAVTMGRLRTAIHTLAGLDLPPAEALERLDLLMSTLGEREPHFATCAYVVYDAVTGRCEVASAGHLPPLIAPPGGAATYLDVPPAPPLGVGDGPVASREFTVEDGTTLFLYTDGLVENRGRDIDDGLARLQRVFDRVDEPTVPSLEDLCDGALGGVFDDRHRDDIAMLVARLRRIPASDHVSWELPAEPAAVRRARGLVRDRLDRWGLPELADSTVLLASELVTNAIRHAGGRVTLRLVREGGLMCEVQDSSDGRPRVHGAFDPGEPALAETGRGLHVVGRLARRWGVRRTATGKAVWCEQALP